MSSPLALPVLGFPCTEYVVLPAVALSMLSGCEERTVPTALRGHTLPWSHSSFSPYTHTTNPRNLSLPLHRGRLPPVRTLGLTADHVQLEHGRPPKRDGGAVTQEGAARWASWQAAEQELSGIR